MLILARETYNLAKKDFTIKTRVYIGIIQRYGIRELVYSTETIMVVVQIKWSSKLYEIRLATLGSISCSIDLTNGTELISYSTTGYSVRLGSRR